MGVDRVQCRRLMAAVALAGLAVRSLAFEASVADPAFTVTVPALPAMPVSAPAAAAHAGASTRLVGGDGQFDMSLDIDDASRPITPRECAGTFLRALVARPGMPARDNIYRAPLNEALFLVIYIFDGEPERGLHAHLVSAAASTHCVEAHFSRVMLPGEDEDAWRRSFIGASVIDGVR